MTAIIVIFTLTLVIVVCTFVVVRQGSDRAAAERTYLESPTWLGASLVEPTAATDAPAEPSDSDSIDEDPSDDSPELEVPRGARLRRNAQDAQDTQVAQDQLRERVFFLMIRRPP